MSFDSRVHICPKQPESSLFMHGNAIEEERDDDDDKDTEKTVQEITKRKTHSPETQMPMS